LKAFLDVFVLIQNQLRVPMKKSFLLASLIAVAAVAACSKKEEAPAIAEPVPVAPAIEAPVAAPADVSAPAAAPADAAAPAAAPADAAAPAPAAK
jgi:hypothetical protein